MASDPVGNVYLDVRARGDKLIADIQQGAAKAAAGAEKELKKRITDALSTAGRVGARALAVGLGSATVAAGALAASTLKVGIEYEQQLNTMAAVTGATAAEMKEASKTARDLGNDLDLPATSAADAAAAMTELGKGGLTAAEAMDAAKGTLQLAAAAQVDGATAAQVQANALNAFSLKADQAGRVADVLANAANAATGEISDFAFGLQASSAVAAQFGLSIEDNVTALALMANAGVAGSDAGTSLKTALLALASPSDAAAAALRDLGIDAFDTEGNFVGLEQIAGDLADAQQRLSQEAFAAATSTAFGSDAARIAGVLAKEGAEGFAEMSDQIGRSGGAAKIAQAQMQGVGGALKGLQSQFETLQIDVFERSAPGLEFVIRSLSDRMPGAADAALDALDRFIVFSLRTAPQVKAAFSEFAPVLQDQVVDRLELAADAARRVLGPALRGVGDVVRAVLPALSELSDTIGNGLQSAVDAAAQVADSFERNAADLGETLSDVVDVVTDAAQVVLPVLTTALSAAADVASGLVSAVSGLHDAMGPLVGPIKATATAVLVAVAAFKALQLVTSGIGKSKTAVVDAFTSISQKATQAGRTISGNLGAASVALTGSLDRGLTASTSRPATALAGVGIAAQAVGLALPALTGGLAIISHTLQSTQDRINGLTTRFQDLARTSLQGGEAGAQAGARLDELTKSLEGVERSAGSFVGGSSLPGQMAIALDRAKASTEQWVDSLSVADAQQLRVTQTQNDYLAAVQRYGANSATARAAADQYSFALAAQKQTQQHLAAATQTTTDKIIAQTQTVQAAANADAAYRSSVVGTQSAQLSLAQAQQAATDAVRTYGADSDQAKQATNNLRSAEVALEQALLGQASAAQQAAEANYEGEDAAGRAKAGADAYKAELARLRDTLAPGNPLRDHLQGLIDDLDEAARPRTSVINVQVRGAEAAAGRLNSVASARAEGGPVKAGSPYLVGEEGPELIVPDRDGYVLTAGITRKLLASAQRASLVDSSQQGVVTINVYAQPGDDVELLARRVSRLIASTT